MSICELAMSPITTARAQRETARKARFLADLGDRHIIVLRNHGLLVVGTSITAAFVATYRMQRACAMQPACQQSGGEFHPIADNVVRAAYYTARMRLAGRRNDPAKFEWPALLRKLDRIDPSYKRQTAGMISQHCPPEAGAKWRHKASSSAPGLIEGNQER
jgi:hypothetical protein